MSHTLKAVDRVELASDPLHHKAHFQGFFALVWGQNAPKWAQNGLKMGSFHPFVHPTWSRMRFGKMRF